ncbi:hypothetical protein DdX_12438 [Ditylenchus destructor]|uniref:Uncharacterized protein n=1 Tax=Ditylenchus destructor TaxID=166010 RepID=A0AAD4MVH1_9BILA|nr:hypothetical protein DdX_12438 [Ditylenchus destructor]
MEQEPEKEPEAVDEVAMEQGPDTEADVPGDFPELVTEGAEHDSTETALLLDSLKEDATMSADESIAAEDEKDGEWTHMTSVNSEQEMFKFCEMNRLLIIHHVGDDRIRMKCKSVIYGCRFAAFAKADDNGTFQIYSKNHHERHKEPLRPKTKLVNKMKTIKKSPRMISDYITADNKRMRARIGDGWDFFGTLHCQKEVDAFVDANKLQRQWQHEIKVKYVCLYFSCRYWLMTIVNKYGNFQLFSKNEHNHMAMLQLRQMLYQKKRVRDAKCRLPTTLKSPEVSLQALPFAPSKETVQNALMSPSNGQAQISSHSQLAPVKPEWADLEMSNNDSISVSDIIGSEDGTTPTSSRSIRSSSFDTSRNLDIAASQSSDDRERKRVTNQRVVGDEWTFRGLLHCDEEANAFIGANNLRFQWHHKIKVKYVCPSNGCKYWLMTLVNVHGHIQVFDKNGHSHPASLKLTELLYPGKKDKYSKCRLYMLNNLKDTPSRLPNQRVPLSRPSVPAKRYSPEPTSSAAYRKSLPPAKCFPPTNAPTPISIPTTCDSKIELLKQRLGIPSGHGQEIAVSEGDESFGNSGDDGMTPTSSKPVVQPTPSRPVSYYIPKPFVENPNSERKHRMRVGDGWNILGLMHCQAEIDAFVDANYLRIQWNHGTKVKYACQSISCRYWMYSIENPAGYFALYDNREHNHDAPLYLEGLLNPDKFRAPECRLHILNATDDVKPARSSLLIASAQALPKNPLPLTQPKILTASQQIQTTSESKLDLLKQRLGMTKDSYNSNGAQPPEDGGHNVVNSTQIKNTPSSSNGARIRVLTKKHPFPAQPYRGVDSPQQRLPSVNELGSPTQTFQSTNDMLLSMATAIITGVTPLNFPVPEEQNKIRLNNAPVDAGLGPSNFFLMKDDIKEEDLSD